VRAAVVAVKAAYNPDGVNVGANLGEAAGAGVPGHIHVNVLPSWSADSNFMTAVAETRVLPESLPVTWRKLRDAWPST
jgi:ATP adenylyltransferase